MANGTIRPAASTAEIKARCAAIELLVVDVDGVMTDGRVIIDDNGVESKHFHVRDGLGFSLWRQAGKNSAIISGRSVPVVNRRAADLGIALVMQGIADKGEALRTLLAETGATAEQVCYIGDDLIDLPALRAAGLACCPADAVEEVRAASHVVALATGGSGAIREIIELILKAQGLWRAACDPYLATTT